MKKVWVLFDMMFLFIAVDRVYGFKCVIYFMSRIPRDFGFSFCVISVYHISHHMNLVWHVM